jgi:outer membrane protein assembly factor BamB
LQRVVAEHDQAAWVTAFLKIAENKTLVSSATPGGEGDVTATRILWKQSRGVPEVPAPLLYKGRVYTVTYRGVVSNLETASGKAFFSAKLGASGAYFSSPVAAADWIYFRT